MVRELGGTQLEEGLVEVEHLADQTQLTKLESFARGIRKDQKAVYNGLTLSYSQGQVEGQVNRLKTI